MTIGREPLIPPLQLYRQSAQLELLDNAGETKLTVLGQEVPDDTIRDVARAKGLDLDTDRLSLPDRITQLHPCWTSSGEFPKRIVLI